MPSKYLNIGGTENTDWFLNYDDTSKAETIFLIGTHPNISFQINSLKDLTISYIVVGGGGGGGFGSGVVTGGGGGGGGVSNGTFNLSANTSFFAQVGKGGFGGNDGTRTEYRLYDGENGYSTTLSISTNTIISSVTGGGSGGSYYGTGSAHAGAPGVPGGGAGGSGSAAGEGDDGEDGLSIDGLYYGGGGGSGAGSNIVYNGGMGGGGGGGFGGIGGYGANGANGGNGSQAEVSTGSLPLEIDLLGAVAFLNTSIDLSRLKGSNGLANSGNGGNGANIGGGGGGGGSGSGSDNINFTSFGGNGGNGIIILYVTESLVNVGSSGGETILSSCFPEKTPINCDQGIIDIDKIIPKYHTIQGKQILSITKSIYELDTIVCIEKDAFYKNVPSKNTLMTYDHKVFYNGKMIEAKKLVDLNDKIYVKKNKSKFVYNVLLEKYDKMLVNNLIVDTLHPESKIAKYYAKHNYILDKEFEETMLTMARGFYKKIHTNNK